ncbi:MAG TPA: SIMPL domain-containing protein [Xanthobacteraceae bacterium]|jgi:hypothetical protein
MIASKAVAALTGGLVAGAAFCAPAAYGQQQQTPEARLVVIGEGTVSVTPDYARIIAGATTRAKTVKEASDTNARIMAAAGAALLQSGIAQRDIQTSRFSVQPVYAPQEPPAEPKLTGYSVSNQVTIHLRDLTKVGDVLDRLITAGVTSVGSISFLVSDQSKALDQGRAAAIADARRKAEIYAHASQLRLGDVAWVTEDTGFAPPIAMRASAAAPAMATSVPIAPGEDMLRVRVTVGFAVAH